MTSTVVYTGNLRTQLTHLYSGDKVITDAPLDNHGLAQAFSPTDLAATSLAACMLTVMGIKARDMQLSIEGTMASVTKVMANDPRRISEIHVHLKFPAGSFTEKDKKVLENTALTCPVARSLHPDIKQAVTFEW